MTNGRRAALALMVTVLFGALLTTASSVSSGAAGAAMGGFRPVVFVHGFAGSGSQFEAQAMRFASNGYPVDYIAVHEYDSLFTTETQDQVRARLDTLIDDIKARTGATQIDLLGHSLGTGLMQTYLNSDPARAANVAHYVNLDGMTAGAPPGGVPTLAVWGQGDPNREITGATNVHFPDQTHVEVVTSPETFEQIYSFFNGVAPATTNIVRQRPGEITIAGRALLFLSNTGVQDATLSVYEVDTATGDRLDATPEATYPLSGNGSWGPLAVDPAKTYEFHIVRAGGGSHHLYFQSFLRTNHLVRLLTSEPDSGLDALWDKSPDHANVAVVRNKEWWGDQPGHNDILEINGTNVINAATAPQSKRAVGLFAFDAGSDGVTDISVPVAAFFGLPFLTGVDLFMPSTSPPNDTISVAATPRGGNGVETINVPNWASATDRVSVQFHDFHATDPPADETAPSTTALSQPATQPTFTG